MSTKIEMPPGIIRLASLLEEYGHPAYLVGGVVRGHLMGLAPSDFDMAGPARPELIADLVEGTPEMSVQAVHKRLGTLHIYADGERVEYTTFRTESYSHGHIPDSVLFTEDIAVDAFRRDFTCNALYYRPATDEIIDPTGGVADIAAHRLRATRPSIMRDDGLRLLRMIRFSAELRFTIEEETYSSADPKLLADIARERIGEEMRKILLSDQRYDLPLGWASLVRALYQLRETELLQAVLPGCDPDDMACSEAPAALIPRLAAWLRPLGASAASGAIMERLRYSSSVAHSVEALIDDLQAPDSEAAYLLCREGPSHARMLLSLRPAWQSIYDNLLASGAPDSFAGLAVSGDKLAELLGGSSPHVGKLKERLFRHVLTMPSDNNEETLLALAQIWARSIKA